MARPATAPVSRPRNFGQGNPGQTEMSDITLENIDVQLKNEQFKTSGVKNFKIENVTVNGKPFSLKSAE